VVRVVSHILAETESAFGIKVHKVVIVSSFILQLISCRIMPYMVCCFSGTYLFRFFEEYLSPELVIHSVI
jgi:hypothetical protein